MQANFSTSRRRSILLEALEGRSYFNAINVADFGAIPDDGKDDLAAISAAINASHAGDTIQFSDGVYDLSNTLTLASNRNYQGSNHAALQGAGPDGQLVNVRGDNVTISDLIFNGGGIFLDKPSGAYNANINIVDNVFNIDSNGQHNNGITFTSGLQDSRIAGNYFTGPHGGAFGIYGYNYQGLTIENNDLVNIAAGMHIDAFGNSGDLLVQQNFIHGARGMGMEFQGAATHLSFLDNWYEHPKLSDNFAQNNNSFGFSLILDKSRDIAIKRNVVIAPERPDGVGCRIGFEVGGDNTIVADNYVNGVNQVLACNDGVGSCSVTVSNNWFANYLEGIGGIRGNAITQKGVNDTDATLKWSLNDVEAGRDSRDIHVSLLPQHLSE